MFSLFVTINVVYNFIFIYCKHEPVILLVLEPCTYVNAQECGILIFVMVSATACFCITRINPHFEIILQIVWNTCCSSVIIIGACKHGINSTFYRDSVVVGGGGGEEVLVATGLIGKVFKIWHPSRFWHVFFAVVGTMIYCVATVRFRKEVVLRTVTALCCQVPRSDNLVKLKRCVSHKPDVRANCKRCN
jgi:hypothetical protein